MAFTLLGGPPAIQSAYKPFDFTWTSNRFPNVIVGESTSVTTVNEADAADVIAYPGVQLGEVIVVHGAVAAALFAVGQKVLIAGNGVYDGVWTVRKEISTTVSVINAPVMGTDGGGTITKYYDNLTLVADIYFTDNFGTREGTPTRKFITPNAAGNNNFYLDVRDVIQRNFQDVFDNVFVPFFPYPAQQNRFVGYYYEVDIREAWIIPDSEGSPVFTIQSSVTTVGDGNMGVNGVQPYGHLNVPDRQAPVKWQEDFTNHIMGDNTKEQRWLTYAPRGYYDGKFDASRALPVAMDESAFLGGIIVYDEGNNWELVVNSYDEAHVLLQASVLDLGIPDQGSFVMGCGPAELDTEGLLHPDVHHYIIALRDSSNEAFFTEPFAFLVDRACYREKKRFYWQNPLGGVDAFTFTAFEGENVDVKRSTVSKPHIAQALGGAGDWQNRMYRTEVDREFVYSTKTLSPTLLRWLQEDLFESVNIMTISPNEYSDKVIPTNNTKTGPRQGRLRFSFTLGTDFTKQRA